MGLSGESGSWGWRGALLACLLLALLGGAACGRGGFVRGLEDEPDTALVPARSAGPLGASCQHDTDCASFLCGCSDATCAQAVCAAVSCALCSFSTDGLSCDGVAEGAVACNDGDGCTVDVCAQGIGCTHQPSCGCATEAECDDGNPCTDDVCTTSGSCLVVALTSACDDGDACTLGDVCLGGACVAGTQRSCDDGNPATDDFCHPSVGCYSLASTVSDPPLPEDENAPGNPSSCGAVTCPRGQTCCNPLCGVCQPPEMTCTLAACGSGI